jgi:ribonucleases P/MRP protein subunit RPP40
MFSQAAPSVYQTSKCHLTYGSMGHVDPKQLPRRGKPWSSLMTLDYIHKVSTWLFIATYDKFFLF